MKDRRTKDALQEFVRVIAWNDGVPRDTALTPEQQFLADAWVVNAHDHVDYPIMTHEWNVPFPSDYTLNGIANDARNPSWHLVKKATEQLTEVETQSFSAIFDATTCTYVNGVANMHKDNESRRLAPGLQMFDLMTSVEDIVESLAEHVPDHIQKGDKTAGAKLYDWFHECVWYRLPEKVRSQVFVELFSCWFGGA